MKKERKTVTVHVFNPSEPIPPDMSEIDITMWDNDPPLYKFAITETEKKAMDVSYMGEHRKNVRFKGKDTKRKIDRHVHDFLMPKPKYFLQCRMAFNRDPKILTQEVKANTVPIQCDLSYYSESELQIKKELPSKE